MDSNEPIRTVPPTSVGATAIKSQPGGQPLHRAAAVIYGDFINVAYAMYENAAAPPIHVPPGFHLVAYVFMSDFVLWESKRVFYGFIATQDNDPFSHVLAVRGTKGWWEWWDDAVFFPTTFKPQPPIVQTQGDASLQVHSGFYRIYRTIELLAVSHDAPPSVAQARSALMSSPNRSPRVPFADQVEAVLEGTGTPHHFVVAGHSLGAALCTLYVTEHVCMKAQRGGRVIVERLCTFGSPRVGTQSLVDYMATLDLDFWRIANAQDLVTMVPPRLPFGYQHAGDPYMFTSEGVTKPSPSCWHTMATYQHWLDGSINVSSACAIQRRQPIPLAQPLGTSGNSAEP